MRYLPVRNFPAPNLGGRQFPEIQGDYISRLTDLVGCILLDSADVGRSRIQE